MATPPGIDVRVNAQPAPRLAVLAVGDQVQIDGAVLHVTRYRTVEIAAPSDELLGRKCALCLVPMTAETRCVVHDCGAVLHLEPETKPAEERLECARMGRCPACEKPVSLESGLVHRPEI